MPFNFVLIMVLSSTRRTFVGEYGFVDSFVDDYSIHGCERFRTEGACVVVFSAVLGFVFFYVVVGVERHRAPAAFVFGTSSVGFGVEV